MQLRMNLRAERDAGPHAHATLRTRDATATGTLTRASTADLHEEALDGQLLLLLTNASEQPLLGLAGWRAQTDQVAMLTTVGLEQRTVRLSGRSQACNAAAAASAVAARVGGSAMTVRAAGRPYLLTKDRNIHLAVAWVVPLRLVQYEAVESRRLLIEACAHGLVQCRLLVVVCDGTPYHLCRSGGRVRVAQRTERRERRRHLLGVRELWRFRVRFRVGPIGCHSHYQRRGVCDNITSTRPQRKSDVCIGDGAFSNARFVLLPIVMCMCFWSGLRTLRIATALMVASSCSDSFFQPRAFSTAAITAASIWLSDIWWMTGLHSEEVGYDECGIRRTLSRTGQGIADADELSRIFFIERCHKKGN